MMPSITKNSDVAIQSPEITPRYRFRAECKVPKMVDFFMWCDGLIPGIDQIFVHVAYSIIRTATELDDILMPKVLV